MSDSRIRQYVEELFQKAPNNKRATELKEELISNMQEKFEDLLSEGKEPEAAFNIVAAGIGDVDELIRGLQEEDVFDLAGIQKQRQKSAVLVSAAVAAFILSIVPAIIFDYIGFEILGYCLMVLFWAAGTFLLIYNYMSKPKYVKKEETIVEDFKEWKYAKAHHDTALKSIRSIVWMLAVLLFFMLGFFLRIWHVAWLVFILALVANQIVKLILVYRDGDPK